MDSRTSLVESLLRWREPALWIVLVGLAANLVLTLVTVATWEGSRATIAVGSVYRVSSAVPIVVLTLLMGAAILVEPIARARLLSLLALVVAGASVLTALVLQLAGLALGGPTSLGDTALLLVALIVPGLAVAVLAKLAVWAPAPDPLRDQPAAHPAALELPAPPAPDPQRQPTWAPDAAAGAVWRTAGDAAAGAPASGWGAPGQPAGWSPIPAAPVAGDFGPANPPARSEPGPDPTNRG